MCVLRCACVVACGMCVAGVLCVVSVRYVCCGVCRCCAVVWHVCFVASECAVWCVVMHVLRCACLCVALLGALGPHIFTPTFQNYVLGKKRMLMEPYKVPSDLFVRPERAIYGNTVDKKRGML